MKAKVFVIIFLLLFIPFHVWALQRKTNEGSESRVMKKQKDENVQVNKKSKKMHNNENLIIKNDIEKPLFFEIRSKKEIYKLKENILSGLSNLTGLTGITGNDSTVDLKVSKNNDELWNVIIKIFNGDKIVMQSRSKIDKMASVIEEDMAIFENNEKNNNDQKQKLTISAEEQKFMGKGKVIRLKEGKKEISEIMVDLEDPITTFMQIIVWVSTIKAIPDDGLKFRWVMNGNPLPVVLREIESEDVSIVCYAVFSNNSDSFSEKQTAEKTKPIVKFSFPKNRKEFMMPLEFELMINSFNIVFQKSNKE